MSTYFTRRQVSDASEQSNDPDFSEILSAPLGSYFFVYQEQFTKSKANVLHLLCSLMSTTVQKLFLVCLALKTSEHLT